MAEFSVTGIVLRRRDSGDSDRRLTLLTQSRGRIEAVAKGARKPASRLAAASEPLAIGSYTIAEGRSVGYVTQVQPLASFSGIRQDYDRLLWALALAEFFAAISHENLENEFAFESLARGLTYIEHHEKPVVAAIWALIQALELEGVLPQWVHCVNTGEPLTQTPAFVSPTAGGHVSNLQSLEYRDAFSVRAEVLIGLDAMGRAAAPPSNLRFANDCLQALRIFLVHHAHAELRALDAAFDAFSHREGE